MSEQPDIIPEVTPAEGVEAKSWDKFINFIKQPVIATLIAAMVSITGTYFAFKVNDKKATVSFEEIGATNFQKLYDLQNTQILNLSIKVDKLTAQNETLKSEISDLKLAQFKSGQNRILFNNSIDAFPFPYWVKTRDGRMVKLNTAFENAYLTPKGLTRLDYIDKTDFDVWSKAEAEAFRRSDQQVVNTKSEQLSLEYATIEGKTMKVLVTKFPILLNGEVIGVAGFAFSENILSKKYFDNTTIK